jgi:phage terminase small subunit
MAKAAEALARLQSGDPVMHGMIIQTKYGDAAVNPLVSIVRKHAADVVRYAGEFGLTTRAPTVLAAGPHAPPQHRSKFDGLLR